MASVERYFLGVDVGGTKTHALISNSRGEAVGFGNAGSGNWEIVGLEGTLQVLHEALNKALHTSGLQARQLAAAGFGMAGYDWPSQRSMLLEALQPLGLSCPIEIVNDATLGILAGTTHGWGVSVVSGTGCNCRGLSCDRGREGRMVGGGVEWSHEYAGGYDIVKRAFQAVTFEWNKRGPATALTQAFLQRTGAATPADLIEGFYVHKYVFEASDVLLVFEAANQGDGEALKALAWAGDQLGQMACGVIRQLDLQKDEVEVVLIGRLFDGHPRLSAALQHTILETAPLARLAKLGAPPVVGGVLLGMEQLMGMSAYTQREAILESTKNMLSFKVN